MLAGMERYLTCARSSALSPAYWVTSSGHSLTQFPHLGEEGNVAHLSASPQLRIPSAGIIFLLIFCPCRLPQGPGTSVSLKSS